MSSLKVNVGTGYTYKQAVEICNRTGGVLPAFASHSEAEAIWYQLNYVGRIFA